MEQILEQENKIIAMILLTNNQLLISEMEQISSELGEPDCRLIKPCLIDQENMEMSFWMESYIPPGVSYFDIHSDKILTMFKPRATLLEKYEEFIK